MNKDELVRLYPSLFHMAAPDSWPLIAQHGLLSTEALLDLFEVHDPERTRLLSERRPEAVTLTHPAHGTAVVRDQIPLHTGKLSACLTDMTVEQWLQLLNSKVFFWMQRQRLDRLLAARAYRTKPHLVITVDTAELIGQVGDNRVTLSRINSGSTVFRAVPRGTDTFRSIADYPHPPRVRAAASAGDVAELCVDHSIPDITSVATRADLYGPDGVSPVWERTIHRS